MSRGLRIGFQVFVSGGVIAYLLWRLDLRETGDLIASSEPVPLGAALIIFFGTTWLMAWRWQILLASRAIDESLGWLTRVYFVGYAVGQVLPTAVGGDAVRIVEHARRRPDAKAEAAAAVIMERVLGAVGTLLLVAVGLAVATGRYNDIRFVVWIEAIFLVVTTLFLVLVFSRRTARHLQETVFPLVRHLRIERPLTSLYVAMHGYRSRPAVLLFVTALTVVGQLVRIAAIWMCGEAVGIDVSPLVYLILGPLLFLIQMVPVTLNGLGVREAFFVAFLVRFDVDKEAALATGLLFYAVTVATSLPGAFFLLRRSLRRASPRPST